MTPEEQKEFNELYKYKEFAKLFFDIFDLDYLMRYYTLIMQPREPYKVEENELRIHLSEEDADKILELAELLEQEVDEDV